MGRQLQVFKNKFENYEKFSQIKIDLSTPNYRHVLGR